MWIDVCFSPALYPAYNQGEPLVVVVDIFRATTCMCVAFETGVESIYPVADINKAKELKSQGFLVGAERDVKKCDFADFGNSPFEYMNKNIRDKEIVMTTTNGTQAINQAKAAKKLMIGAFSNLSVLADHCLKQEKNILVLCSGWNNQANLEDTLFSGAFVEQMIAFGNYTLKSDAVSMALSLWKGAKKDAKAFLNQSEHVQRLLKHKLEKDIDYCLTLDTTKSLPYYDKESGKLYNINS